VLDLPPKIETVHECPMTKSQLKLYKDTLKRSRKMLEEMTDEALVGAADEDDAVQTKNGGPGAKAKAGAAAKAKAKTGVMSSGSGANVLMDLRKAASHPLLFRKKYSNAIIKKLAKELLNTPKWCDAGYDYVVEDLEVSHTAEVRTK
jgi:SWI/SNF-related matrix-associated actin-dependent regulator 1 of chromatin subfamily A